MPALAPPPQLTPEHEAAMAEIKEVIEAARVDPLYLAELLIVSEGDTASSHKIHRLIQEHIQACRLAGRHCVIICPPEHGKSVQVLSSMIHATALDRGRNCGIVSASDLLSKKHMARIRKFVLSAYFKELFPEFDPDLRRGKDDKGEWSSTALYLVGQSEPAFQRFPLEGAGEGHRLDEVWLDDCVKRECQFSEAERRNSASAIKDTWLNRLKRGGIAIITNNVWHKDDVIHEMMASESYSTLRIQYEGVERFHFQVINAPATWKFRTEGDLDHWAQWPIVELEKKRGEGIRNWKGRFEQRLINPEECIFPPKEEWARYADVKRDREGNPTGKVIAFLDPNGGSESGKGDFAVIWALMCYPDDTADVVGCWCSNKVNPEEQCEAPFEMHEDLKRRGLGGIHKFYFEMMRTSKNWVTPMFTTIQNRRRAHNKFWQLPWEIHYPWQDKDARIMELDAVLKAKPPMYPEPWLRWPENLEALRSGSSPESRSWATAIEMIELWRPSRYRSKDEHDDSPDALQGCWEKRKGLGISGGSVVSLRGVGR